MNCGLDGASAESQVFIYCVARRGVTGVKSVIGAEVVEYLGRCRQATILPLAVGFGIQNHDDVRAFIGKADMAVIGSQTIRLVDEKGAGRWGRLLQVYVSSAPIFCLLYY